MNAPSPSLLPTQPVVISLTRRTSKLLIVDDEPAIARFIEEGLRFAGFNNLITAANGSQVPTRALAERPDLIIMDVMMPGGNGLKALRTLRSHPVTARIPVIIMSGFGVPTVGETEQCRPDRVLAKPFTIESLLKAVGCVLPATGQTQAVSTFPDIKAMPA